MEAMTQTPSGPAHQGLDRYRRRRKAEKRRAILDAARAELRANGFENMVIVEIARLADVSTATLYKHFNSKEELACSVLMDIADREGTETAAAFVCELADAEVIRFQQMCERHGVMPPFFQAALRFLRGRRA